MNGQPPVQGEPPPPSYPLPWVYKGQAWIFLLSLSDQFGRLISHVADHDAAKGQLTGGPGTLSLYHYTDSPIGAYDELSFSPGWYEYMTHAQPQISSTAKRITKSFVTCGDREISILRRNWGLPAERAVFNWTTIAPNEFNVVITLPNGIRVIEMTIQPRQFFTFKLNTVSWTSEAFDLARLVPIVQPALDGYQPPLPPQAGPHPHSQLPSMLKSYSSLKGETTLVRLKKAVSNPQVFPPIEELHVLKWGLAISPMEMTLREADVVLDTNAPPLIKSRWYIALSNFIKSIAFEKLGSQ